MDSGDDQAARGLQSKALHIKGGWRDHSDGNRVTTTRGDKVEVIGGNYKLVVLGRQDLSHVDDAAHARHVLTSAAGFDMSGGLTDPPSGGMLDSNCRDLSYPDTGATNAAGAPAVTVEYTWRNGKDNLWSWTKTTVTGAESPSAESYGNARVVNRTWVDSLDEQRGSSARPIAFVNEQLWAHKLDTEIHVDGTNDNTVTGGTLETITMQELIMNFTAALASVNTQVAGAILEADGAALIGLAQAGIIPSVYAAILIADLHLGMHIDCHHGEHLEARTGLHTENHAGLHVESHMGVHVDGHLGAHFELQNGQFTVNGGEAIGSYTSWAQISDGDAVDLVNTHLSVHNIYLSMAQEHQNPG